MTDRKSNVLPDKYEGLFFVGTYVLVSGSILSCEAQRRQTHPSASTVKTLQKSLFLQRISKKMNISFAHSGFINRSNNVTVIKLCIVTVPSLPCT